MYGWSMEMVPFFSQDTMKTGDAEIEMALIAVFHVQVYTLLLQCI
jgi:hypothetical protein